MRIRQEAARYAMLALGAAILAFGLYNVHSQSHITEGGVLGMTLLMEHWLGVSPAVSEVVLDGICYALGLRYLGKAFLPHALAATGCFALFYALNERIGPLLPNLGGMPLAAAVAGGMFVGVGVGLVVRAGGAAGGDDALALVLSKKLGWKLPAAYLATDLTVLLLSLSYLPPVKIACSLVTVTISSFLIGRLEGSGKRKETC
ncbi:MAG TPA: YitT family protein [Candidatus Limiplasma pullicola]|nr:YitT family protein [Candidatus Limiplasma pullicola]